MALPGHSAKYCERCGTELLSADPAPLCATCWLSEGAVMVPRTESVNGVYTRRGSNRPGPEHYRPRHTQLHNEPRPPAHPRRRIATAVALCLLSVLAMSASAPSTFAASAPATPLHFGAAQLNASADACISKLWVLIADTSEGRSSDPGVVCPTSNKPYLYTQYRGITTISCPNPARHGAESISVRSDTKVPVAR